MKIKSMILEITKSNQSHFIKPKKHSIHLMCECLLPKKLFSCAPRPRPPSNTSCAEVTFIDSALTFYGRFCLTVTGNSFPESHYIEINGIMVDSRQFRDLGSCQTNGKCFTSCRIFASKIIER